MNSVKQGCRRAGKSLLYRVAGDVREDLNANRHDWRSLLVVVLYRIARHQATSRPRTLRARIASAIYRLVAYYGLCVDIPVACRIGPGLKIRHAFCIVIHEAATVGSDFDIRHGVTVGARGGRHGSAAPSIGDRVTMGSHAQILGNVVIDCDVFVGAGAIVTRDIPHGSIAVGNPAVVKQRGDG